MSTLYNSKRAGKGVFTTFRPPEENPSKQMMEDKPRPKKELNNKKTGKANKKNEAWKPDGSFEAEEEQEDDEEEEDVDYSNDGDQGPVFEFNPDSFELGTMYDETGKDLTYAPCRINPYYIRLTPTERAELYEQLEWDPTEEDDSEATVNRAAIRAGDSSHFYLSLTFLRDLAEDKIPWDDFRLVRVISVLSFVSFYSRERD